MNRRFLLPLSGVAAVLLMMTGCAEHDGAAEHAEAKPARESGHSFKEGRGVFLTDATIRTLGVLTAEPQEKTLASRLETSALVYAPGRATVLLDSAQAVIVASGHRVELGSPLNTSGILTRLDRQMEKSLGQIEALIEFDAPSRALPIGVVIPVAFTTGAAQSQLVVPSSSLLQTGEGHFVFVVNGGRFLRSRVRLGTRHGDWTAVTDGLLAGDVIVTNGVSALWCLELQATKAGAGCCPAPLK
jgi:multidrug efflux pump subunit AcrA (membrane-fusion protein)